jgi:DNA-binding MarR family transcriptional regulator
MGESQRLAGLGGCPSVGEVEVLQRWNALQIGFRELTDQLLADAQREVGLPPSSLEVLIFLISSPEQAAPMRLLSQTLGFSTAGTTGVVDRLSEAGLLERRPSNSDRRVTFAALTPLGRETATAVAKVFADAVRRRVMEPLGGEGFESFAAAFVALGLVNEPGTENTAPDPC